MFLSRTRRAQGNGIGPVQERSQCTRQERSEMIPHRRQVLARFLLLTALALASVGIHAQDPNADIYGKWKITALIGGGAVSSRSQRQVEKMIGKIAIISAERFEFNGETCTYPNYQRSHENPSTYFDREWRTDVRDIAFPNPVTIIETGCAYLYPIRKNHLMIADEGDFFEAVRVKSMKGAK